MDPVRFFSSSKTLIVAGKGGVGKTVLSAILATASARLGLSTLLVEVGGRSSVEPVLGVESIGYEPVEVSSGADDRGALHARSITPDDALVEWLSLHGFRRLVERMARSGLLEVIATATPGIKDLLVLGKIRNLETTGAADLIVVDAPAAGHALGFLRAPATIKDTARAGTIHHQADEALEMLSDPSRCRVMLVTVAEETPVNELVETAFAIEDEIGVRLTPIVVNSVLPELAGLDIDVAEQAQAHGLDPLVISDLCRAAEFRAGRDAVQSEQLERLDRMLPLDQIRLPQLFGPTIGPAEIEILVDELIDQLESIPEPVG
jgi:anion-transporting  ArsA/GET3 family ATPase